MMVETGVRRLTASKVMPGLRVNFRIPTCACGLPLPVSMGEAAVREREESKRHLERATLGYCAIRAFGPSLSHHRGDTE
jgi:hypothetical protein